MLKFPAKAKTSFYLITATTGFAAAFNFHSLNPNFPAFSDDSLLLSSTFPEKIRTGINAVFRSSRAVTTIALNVVDYKYSLHGLPLKSEEYRHTLSEVCRFFFSLEHEFMIELRFISRFSHSKRSKCYAL